MKRIVGKSVPGNTWEHWEGETGLSWKSVLRNLSWAWGKRSRQDSRAGGETAPKFYGQGMASEANGWEVVLDLEKRKPGDRYGLLSPTRVDWRHSLACAVVCSSVWKEWVHLEDSRLLKKNSGKNVVTETTRISATNLMSPPPRLTVSLGT